MTTSDGFCLGATIILFFPMMYFLIVSPNFFFFKFADPTVAKLLRGLFNTYFLSIGGCCAIAVIVFAVAGRPLVALGLATLGALALGARRWFVERIDGQLRARDAGDVGAPRRLRRLHVGGILYNTVQLVALVASFPFVFVAGR